MFLAVSVIPCLVPRGALQKLQQEKRRSLHEWIGVSIVNTVSQDGTLVRRAMALLGGMPAALLKEADRRRVERTTYVREQFHLSGLVFFACVTVAAALQRRPAWTAFLLAANVLYNVLPVLLQQSIRHRLRRIDTSKRGRQDRPL